MKAKSLTARIVIHTVLVAGSLVFLFPLAWMISTSLKPIEETMTLPPKWIPSAWQWGNYVKAVTYQSDKLGYYPFVVYGRNTLYLCILGVAGTVFANALIAYGFARVEWRGRNVLFALTLATMMIPFPVTMVPLYALFRELHWIGTFKPLWVPAWFGSAFNIFLLRQFFRTIPQELSDAARVDGCSEWGIFTRIILPLSKPALAVVALFHFMYVWNDFLGPLIYLMRQDTFTLALGLQFYQSQHGGTEWHLLMAAATLVVLPVILLFFFTQRTFIQGIALTGMKG
jgi:multiple sugar transport system permease protein